MNPIEKIKYKEYEIKLYQDEDPISPRENDNLGTMLCKHRNYNLGDEKESKEMDVDDIKRFVLREDVISIPLYLLDHSGLWMRTGSFDCDPGGWDTSMVGYITVTHEKVKKEYKKKRISKALKKMALKVMEQEVQTYSDFLEGNIVGYIIEKDGKQFDSCWGFYPEHNLMRGRSEYAYMIAECQSLIDGYVKEDERKAHIEKSVTSA